MLAAVMALVAATPCCKKARKQRATVIRIDGSQLQANWKHLAQQKFPGFEWDGSHYPKPSKSGTPCKAELEMCADALLGLALVAPSGYCCKPELKDTLMQMHEDYKIMKITAEDLEKGNTPIVKAEKACEVWQAMLKHCLILKQQTRVAVSPKLKLVFDALDDQQGTITSAWTPPRSILATDTTPSLLPSRRDTIPVNADGFPDFDTLDAADDADGALEATDDADGGYGMGDADGAYGTDTLDAAADGGYGTDTLDAADDGEYGTHTLDAAADGGYGTADLDADVAIANGAARHVPFVHKTSLRRPPRYQGQP